MAHHIGSQSSGFSLAQSQLIRVPSSTSETPLDLNLSQKVSQNFFKGHEETDLSDSQAKSFDVIGSSQAKSGLAPDVSMSNANGFVDSIEHSNQQHRSQNAVTKQRIYVPKEAVPNEPPQSSLATTDSDEVNELTPASVLGKRKSSRADIAARIQKEVSQSGTATLDDGSSQGNETSQLSPGQKRKSLRVKQQTTDVTKKVILALEANEEEGLPKPKSRPRGGSYASREMGFDTPRSRSKSLSAASDAPSDLAERRLLLEERKVRLAEQRFALEEKKLEATIEIGKGLIVSMERMTTTISALGAPLMHQ